MHEKVYVVDCCGFCSYPPPHRPPMRAKFRPASSFFVRDFPHYQTRVVLRIFQPDLCSHDSTVCPDSLEQLDWLESPICSRDFSGERSAGRRLRVFPYFAALKHGRRKDELLLFAGRVAHLKPDQLRLIKKKKMTLVDFATPLGVHPSWPHCVS